MKKLLSVLLAILVPALAFGQAASVVIGEKPIIQGATGVQIVVTGTGEIRLVTSANTTAKGFYINETTGDLTSVGGAGVAAATLTNPTISGNLTFSTAAAKIIPGATSLTFRNNADSASNLSITDAGLVTVGVGNLALAAGNLTFSAASARIIPGATSILFRNNANDNSNLNILDDGTIGLRGSLTSSFTGALGWTPVNAANQACNTTCTSACVFGMNTGALGNFVSCSDATADTCICAGAS